MAHDVFISYSSRDKAIADAVCAALENTRIRCWIAPRDVLPGKEWGEAIVDAIGASKLMVLIFSSASNNSQQVLREVERAVNKNVVIVPFRIEDIVPTRSMEYFLYSTHWLDALTPDVEEYIDILVDTVGKFINSEDKIDTTSRPFIPEPKREPVKSPVKVSLFKKYRMALFIVLCIILAGFGVYGLAATLIKPEADSAMNTPVATDPLGTEASNEIASSEPIPTTTHNPDDGSSPTPSAPDSQSGAALSGTSSQETGTEGQSSQQGSSTDSVGPSESKPVQSNAPESIPAEAKTKLKVGQVLQFGSYYGKPVNWTVIHINDEGQPLLLTTNIVTLKPFDASESGTYNKIGDRTFDNKMPKSEVYTAYTPEDMRAMKGSNAWADSNLRQWLNSDQKQVSYSTQPPSTGAVWYGYNDYDKEKGFLYNFTEAEKSMIKKVKHKAIVSLMEKDSASGGKALYQFSRASLDEALFNSDEAYSITVEDQVFLLSVDEALTYIYDRGELLKAFLTEDAIERDESGWYNDLKHEAGGSFMWWLRTPNASTPCEVCIVGTTGDVIYSDYAVLCGVGVRPACYLNASEFAVTGAGTQEDPYILK